VFLESPVCANAFEARDKTPTNTKMLTFFIHASYCIGEGCKWEPRSELFAELSSELFVRPSK
jgi:hypothetical protein